MKKIFALIVLSFIGIGIVAWLANYFSTGTITITTGNKNDTVTLQKTSGGKPLTKIALGSLSASVKHGQYTATVKNGLKTTIQVINFNSGHKTFHYSIALAEPLSVETVLHQNVQDIAVNNRVLVYLDNSSGTLHKIDSQNSLQEIGKEQQFRTVKWTDPSFGVGQSKGGYLYTVTGDSVSQLKVPFSYDRKAVDFDVSSDKKIYVSHGKDVYVGSEAGAFKKIYTAASSNPTLAAGLNGLAISDSKYGGKANDIAKPLLATINTSDKKTKKNVEAERLAWSPNGQYLATVNQASPTVYDASLHQVAVVPTSSVVGQFKWLNNTTLVYTSSYQLWTYSLTDQKTRLLSDVSSINSITGIYVNSDASYVYMTTLNSFSSKYAVRRVSLKNSQIPDYVYKLQAALPEKLTGYSISLINFSLPPTILVRPYTAAPPDNYVQKAQSQLQSQGFNTAQLRFQLGTPILGD